MSIRTLIRISYFIYFIWDCQCTYIYILCSTQQTSVFFLSPTVQYWFRRFNEISEQTRSKVRNATMLCMETDNGFAYRSYTAAVLNVSIRLIGVDNFSRPKSQSAKNRKIDLPILEINTQKKENPHK